MTIKIAQLTILLLLVACGGEPRATPGLATPVRTPCDDFRFNTPLLAADYRTLAHVQNAEANTIVGDSNDVCVFIEQETTYHYIFDAGSGDCPAGCIDHDYWGFTTTKDAPGVVTPIGKFSRHDPGAPPDWFTALSGCSKWL